MPAVARNLFLKDEEFKEAPKRERTQHAEAVSRRKHWGGTKRFVEVAVCRQATSTLRRPCNSVSIEEIVTERDSEE